MNNYDIQYVRCTVLLSKKAVYICFVCLVIQYQLFSSPLMCGSELLCLTPSKLGDHLCVCVCVRFSPSTFNVIFLAPFLLINPWPSLSDWTKCQCCAVTQRQKSIHLRQFVSTDSRDKSEKRFVWACRGVHTGRPYSSVRSAAEWRKKHREHTLQTKHFVIDWIYL